MAVGMVSRRLIRLALRLGLAIYVVGLICGDLVQHSFQSAFGNVNSTFVLPLFLGPVVLVPCPQLVGTVRIFLLCPDLLLGCFQPSLDVRICVDRLVTFPRELGQS